MSTADHAPHGEYGGEYGGGFWRLFDTMRSTPVARPLSAEDERRRSRIFAAAKALARGDYGPARAVLAED